MLGESLHLTLEYLASEAKVKSARSYVTTLEAENSKLKKELIVAMNKANLVKEKLKTLTEELRVERELTMEKDEQLAATKEKIKRIAGRPSRASIKLRITTLYFSVGTSRGLSFWGDTSLSTPLQWTRRS